MHSVPSVDRSVFTALETTARFVGSVLEKIAAGTAINAHDRTLLERSRSHLEQEHCKVWSSVDPQFAALTGRPDLDTFLADNQGTYGFLALVSLPPGVTDAERRAMFRHYRDIIAGFPEVSPADAGEILPYVRSLALFSGEIGYGYRAAR